MSVTWSRLAGDTSRFAVSLALEADPDDGQGADPDDAASWGALELWVEGKNLAAHTVDGVTSDAVQWYLLPFLEWVAEAWNPLLHEEKPPAEPQSTDAVHDLKASLLAPPTLSNEDSSRWEERWYEWWGRHSLRAPREGGLLPNVVFRRWRDSIEISWEPEPVPGAGELQFHVPYGRARLAPNDVAWPLYEASLDTVKELRERNPKSTRVNRLRRKLESLCDSDLSETRLLWMVDASPRGRARRQWRRVKRALEDGSKPAREAALSTESDDLVIRGSCHAALLFGAVSPSLGNDDIAKLATVLIEAYDPRGERGPLAEYARPQPVGRIRGPVWEEGWRLAEELLDALSPSGSWIDVEGLLAETAVPVRDVELADEEIRGLSIAGRQHRWTMCINPAYHDGNDDEIRRFTMAHELCHLLYDRGVEQKVAIASGPWAPKDVERRANAFAAMFLMPRDRVRAACRDAGKLDTLDAIDKVARALHTSVTATLHHLSNLYVIDEGMRDRLLAQHQHRGARGSA